MGWWPAGNGVRTTMLAVAVVPALLGALTSPARVTLVAAPLVGAVAAAVPRLAAWGLDLHRPSRRTLTVVAAVGVLSVPLVAGTALLAPGDLVLPAALLALAATGLGFSAGSPSPRGDGAGARPPTAPGARSRSARRR